MNMYLTIKHTIIFIVSINVFILVYYVTTVREYSNNDETIFVEDAQERIMLPGITVSKLQEDGKLREEIETGMRDIESSTILKALNVDKLRNLYEGFDTSKTLYDYEKQFKRSRVITTSTVTKDLPSFAFQLYWSKDNEHYPICQLHNVCINENGTVLLHQGLKKFTNHFKYICRISNFQFHHVNKYDYKYFSHEYNVHLFGSSQARNHIPHFLTDVLPVLYGKQLIWHSSSNTYSNCFLPFYSYSNRTRHCALRRDEFPNLALFVEHAIMNMSASNWVPQFIGMMMFQNTSYPISKLYSLYSMFHEYQHQFHRVTDKVCFKSILSYGKYSFQLNDSRWLENESNLFSNYGIIKKPLHVRKLTMNKSRKQLEQVCQLNIVIIDRQKYKYNGKDYSFQGRNIDNVKYIFKDLKENMKPHKVSIHYLESKTLVEQIQVMQYANIIIGVHGAGLSNIVFSKQNTTALLEIFPFTYYAGPFHQLSSTLNYQYSSMISEPDTLNFFKCIQLYAKQHSDDFPLYNEAVLFWSKAVKERNLTSHQLTSPVGSIIKVCARLQSVFIDVTQLTEKVSAIANRMCSY